MDVASGKYESIAAAWFTALYRIVQGVFWILVAIELVCSAIWWVIPRGRADRRGVLVV